MALSMRMDKVQCVLCKVSGLDAVGSASFVTIANHDDSRMLASCGVEQGEYLVTSSKTLNLEDIAQSGKFLAEFLVEGQKQTRKFVFEKSENCSLGLRVYGREASCVPEEGSLLFVPTNQLVDQRNLVKKFFSKSVLQRVPLTCSFLEIDPKAEAANGRLRCRVLTDTSLEAQPFHYRLYKIEVDDSCGFILKENGSETKVKFMEDFGKEEKPHGSPITTNNDRALVGVLSCFREGERWRIKPIWIGETTEATSKRKEKEQSYSAIVAGFSNISTSEPSESTDALLEELDDNKLAVAVNRSLTHSSPIDDTNPPKDDAVPPVIGHVNNNVVDDYEDQADPPDDPDPDSDSASATCRNGRRRHSAVPIEHTKFPKVPAVRSYSVREPFPIKPDTMVKDFVDNVSVMEALAQLDRVQPDGRKKCYLHLALHFEVPSDVLVRIQASSTNHPCERLFFYLTTIKPEINFGSIKDGLKAIGREDVVVQLEHISDEEKLSEMSHDLSKVYAFLETAMEPMNWEGLGKHFKVDLCKLEVMKTSSSVESQTQEILEKAYCHNASLTIGDLKKKLVEIEREDVCNVLASTFKDSDTIDALLNELGVLGKVSFLLNREKPGVSNWQHLARKLGISREEYSYLTGDTAHSPTRQIIEFISRQNQQLSVEDLFGAIAGLPREDVFKSLKLYFKAEDVDRILNEAQRKRLEKN